METKLYRAMTALLWLALPLTGLQYWSVWNQLPARMATHFAASGQPNGWMTRQVSLVFVMGLTAILLATFSWALSRVRKPDILAWSLLVMSCVILGALFNLNAAVLNYNIYGSPLNFIPGISVICVAAVAVTAIALMTQRGPQLPNHPDLVQAEEVHDSLLWALIFGALTAFVLTILIRIQLLGLRLAMALPALLIFGGAALAWSGFHYRFTSHGVEIRTLGFRLRSIPLHSIESYGVEPWSVLGGYGIRGIGNSRAYVWCNSGVRIRLVDGDVFLGHRDPEKIVKDLDLITENQKAREHTRSESE